jgi:hypothetical protein
LAAQPGRLTWPPRGKWQWPRPPPFFGVRPRGAAGPDLVVAVSSAAVSSAVEDGPSPAADSHPARRRHRHYKGLSRRPRAHPGLPAARARWGLFYLYIHIINYKYYKLLINFY